MASLTWLARGQLDVAFVNVRALGLGATAAIIPRFAKPVPALDLAHSGPPVSLDLTACLRRLLLRGVDHCGLPLEGGCLWERMLHRRRMPFQMGLAQGFKERTATCVTSADQRGHGRPGESVHFSSHSRLPWPYSIVDCKAWSA